MMEKLTILLIICNLTLCAFSGTIYVDANGTGDYLTIQEGINAANNGDTVIVADGTYTGPGNKNLDFGGLAITLQSENGPENCIIDCENDGRGFYFHSGEGRDSIIDGFTITHAYLLVVFPSIEGGGAIYCWNSSPTLKNCVFNSNSVSGAGGGGIESMDSSILLQNCFFIDNSAEWHGGGMYNEGGGNITLINCTFTSNSGYYGGGIYSGNGQQTLTNCKFNSNTAFTGGGIDNSYCDLSLTNCTFSENTAWGGGGMRSEGSDTTLTNCIFTENPASQFGGGMYNLHAATPILINCTFYGNSAGSQGGGIRNYGSVSTLTNCIFWNNSDAGGTDESAQIHSTDGGWAAVNYSCIQGGWSGSGSNNISGAPLFVTGPSGDYYLSQIASGQDVNSPCVDTGSDTAFNLNMHLSTTRTDGEHDTGIVDMGYHYVDTNVPALKVFPLNLNFVGKQNGANPASQTITIRNLGIEPLNWTAAVDVNWLTVDPCSGSCPDYGDANTVTVDVNAAGFTEGTYPGYITVSDPCALNSPQTVAVQLSVIGPVIGLSESQFSFQAIEGGDNPANQVLGIQNTGGGTLNWQVTDPCDWLSIDPNFGSSTGEVDDVNIIVGISGLTEGHYTCGITVSSDDANNSPQTVFVILKVVKCNIADLDKDLLVDYNDLDILVNQWLQAPGIPSADIAPPQGDGFVDFLDLAILCRNWLDGYEIPNLVAHWKLDEGIGGIAYDSAGGNNGTLYGPPAWTTGKIGSYALDFDGTSDYVRVPDHDSISVGNQDYTICAWIKLDTLSNNTTIVSKVKDGDDKEYLFTVISDATFRLGVEKNGNNQLANTTVSCVTTGSWQHAAVTFDSDTKEVTFYHDGDEIPSTSSIDTLPDQLDDDLYIGMIGGTYYTAHLDGLIDDVRLYDRVLSEQEILELYEMGQGYKATNPNPADGDAGVDPNTILTWSPGKDAISRDVYLGTDFNDVNDATPVSDEYMGNYPSSSYDPCGLDINTTYYWRIDEVTDTNIYKGDCWSFTTWVIEPNLVSYWKFDGNANDSAGSNHGTAYGDANFAPGMIGQALDCDGDNDYVVIPDDDSLTPSDEITIACWVYNRGGQNAGIYKYAACPGEPASPGNSRSYTFGLSYNNDYKVSSAIFQTVSTYDGVDGNTPVPLNEWHHVAMTFNRGQAKVYLDGEVDGEKTMSVTSIMNDVQPLYFGGNWEYCDEDSFRSFLNGMLDDVRIYDRALSASDVNDLYMMGN